MAKQPSSAPKSGLKGWQKSLLIHFGILAAFYLITAIYFHPVVFDDQMPDQHDIIEYQGMAKETNDFRKETGEEALWVSSLFSGMPAYQTSIRHYGNLFWQINQLLWFGLPRPANYIFLIFAGFFFLLRVLKVNPWLSAAGATAFAFSSYFFVILDVGHTSKANAVAYMAPLLASVMLTYRGKYLLGGALTAIFTALELTCNHYQVTYYLILMLVIMAIFMLVDALRKDYLMDFLKASGILLLAGGIGLGPSFAQVWTTLQYSSDTMRGKTELSTGPQGGKNGLDINYAFRWSYGIDESFTLLIPNYYGGASQVQLDRQSDTYKEIKKAFGNSQQVNQILNSFPAYWGTQPGTSGPVYVGAIVVFLFFLGLMLVSGPTRWWLLAATLFGLVLSWGRNLMWFNELMFNYLPVYNKFRAPTISLIIVEFTMPLLGILGLQKLIEDAKEPANRSGLQRKVLIAGGIAGGLALFFALLGPALLSFSGPSAARMGQLASFLEDHRESIFRADAFRSFGLVAASALLIWLYLRGSIKQNLTLFLGLTALIMVDLVPVANRYLNEDSFISKRNYEANFAPSQADQFILQDSDPNFRVLNLSVSTWNDALTSYHHKSIGGYHAAKLQRYSDLIERHLQREIQQFVGVLQNQQGLNDSLLQATLSQLRVLNMLNGRYFILNPQGRPVQNSFALGNAWYVQQIERVNSPDEEIAALNQIDPKSVAIVDVEYDEGRFAPQLEGIAPGQDPNAQIVLTDWKPNYLTYQSNSQAPGVAIFSEVYYNDTKGWNAYIDGKKVPHFRANYLLRGLVIPAGKHQIEFKFEPKAYDQGNQVSLVFSILTLLLLGLGLWAEFRPRKISPVEEDA